MQFQHLIALDVWKFHFRIYSGKGSGGQRERWKAPCKSGGSHAFTVMFVSSNLPLGFNPMTPTTKFILSCQSLVQFSIREPPLKSLVYPHSCALELFHCWTRFKFRRIITLIFQYFRWERFSYICNFVLWFSSSLLLNVARLKSF